MIVNTFTLYFITKYIHSILFYTLGLYLSHINFTKNL